ncbi:hypothetical protein [Pseudomonas yamanorum]|uniref:Uncharacterized protein n=1 Tax=Pseudomonas yamanorum TaxID=515393 RepID=A0A7Y8JN80_9PSED|nr:hypothetical protein [Pseudomonas yamanorum]NWE12393.1 hypothetical protein [Pseudomonas yamanorum]
MNKAPGWLHTTLSIPIYTVSVVFWMFTAYMIVTATVKMLSRFVTPEQIGEGFFDLFVSVVLAAAGSGLWILARYIRTSNFKKQASIANLP